MGRFIPNEETWIGFATAQPGAYSAPAAPTAVASGTGGTLPAATYDYKLTVVTSAGESLPSSASTGVTTTGSTSKITVSWTAVPGASAYRLYGRSSGTELFIAQIPHGTTSFVDTGAVTPAGALPTSSAAYDLALPHVSDITGAVDLTHFVTSINASTQGNDVPTPAFDQLFETSIAGTAKGSFTADFYRDSTTDTAWNTLARSTAGWFIIARYGSEPNTVGDKCEVWPVRILSRSVANMTNNAVVTFTVTCAVPDVPAEDAVVVA